MDERLQTVVNTAIDRGLYEGKPRRQPRPYHTLLSRESKTAPWVIEFGDYERGTVEAEREDYRDHDHKLVNLKIITTGPTSPEIAAAVAELNSKET